MGDKISRRKFLKGAGYLSVGAGLGGAWLSRAEASHSAGRPRRTTIAQNVKKVEGVSLGPPSNSTYFIPIIKERGLDKKNGIELDIKFYSDLSAMYSDFAAGRAPFAFTSAFFNAANFYNKGVPIQIIFTYSSPSHAVVTRNPAIKTTADLRGKTIAATTGSGLYGLVVLHLKQNGIDPRKDVNVISAAVTAIQTQLEADKIDAGVVWEPALSMLLLKGFRMVGDMYGDIRKSLGMAKDARIWHLGAYAWKKWIDEDAERVMATYRCYKDAEKFFYENQGEAIEIISKFTKISKEALKISIERKLADFAVIPAIQEKDNMMKVFEGFVKTGFMEKLPDEGIFYPWPKIKT